MLRTIDSSGLGTLVPDIRRSKGPAADLKLTNLSEKASELMTITKLYTVFDVI